MFSRTFAAVIVAVLLSLGLGACTQRSSGPISQSNLSTLLQNNGLSKNFANCVAKKAMNGFTVKVNGQAKTYKKLTDAQRKAFNQNNPSKADTDAVYNLSHDAGVACKQQGLNP